MKIFKNALINFVYPFQFDAERFDAFISNLDAAEWQGRSGAFRIWERKSFTEPQEDLLPHVARYLNTPEGTPSTAQLWELQHDALQSPNGGLGGNGEWQVTTPHGEIDFRLDAVQLTLFRVGVAFLTVRARPTTQEVDDWLDFLHYFRFVNGQRGVRVTIQRRTGKSASEPFFPDAAGGVAQHPDGVGRFGAIVSALLKTADGDESEAWWSDVFVPGQTLPFAALYIDDVQDNDLLPMLYRVRKFFHARQEIHPSQADLRPDHPAVLDYAQGQWFTFSLDGGAFVAFDAPNTPFFRETMPQAHLPDQYFLLFLLALHQRFALTTLSEAVANHWLINDGQTDDAKREAVFRRIRDALLSFTARGMFTQVMQREHHHRCYRKWQETFQLEALYREVNDEVHAMHDYLQMRRTEQLEALTKAEALAEAEREKAAQQRAQHLERLVTFFGMLIAAFGITIGTLGLKIIGLTDNGIPLKWAVIIGFGGGLLLTGFFWLLVWVVSRLLRRRGRDER